MTDNRNILHDHVANPRNVGRLENPDAVGKAGRPGRGAFMIIDFRIVQGTVTEVRYQTFGCGPAIAAGSMLTEMIRGRSVEKCMALTAEELRDALGGLPADKAWCADLALTTMRNALEGRRGNAE